MNKTWNVTIFIEEDGATATAHARFTGGNPTGHLVGHGSCRTTSIARQDAGRRAAVHALADLSSQLEQVLPAQPTGDAAGTANPGTPTPPRHPHTVPRGLLSLN